MKEYNAGDIVDVNFTGMITEVRLNSEKKKEYTVKMYSPKGQIIAIALIYDATVIYLTVTPEDLPKEEMI